MIRIIELVDKVNDGNGYVDLIAECNDYNDLGIRVRQLSRSPFKYPETMTDQEIIDALKLNEYKQYF